MVPVPTRIYHITHIDNLPSILDSEGLDCCSIMRRNSNGYVNIAYQSIQDRRAFTNVPIHPFGNLHDYVPFYFAPRSPMLYTINRGNVEGYDEGQRPVIHLVTTVQLVIQEPISYVFTDGHGIMAYTNFYNEIDELCNLDWELMNSRYWHDTIDYPDRKRKRQAEFLVQSHVSWQLITEIGVINQGIADSVQIILDDYGDDTPVEVYRDWYY